MATRWRSQDRGWARHHDRVAPSRSGEPEDLLGNSTLIDRTAEPYLEGTGGQTRIAKRLGRTLDDGVGLLFLLGDPPLPLDAEGSREPLLGDRIPRAAVFEQARRKLGQHVDDGDAKSPTATQQVPDIRDCPL